MAVFGDDAVSHLQGRNIPGLRWDGRNPDEEEDTYRRRCLLQASKMVGSNGVKKEIK
jgi:hypothetical protein